MKYDPNHVHLKFVDLMEALEFVEGSCSDSS